MTREEVLDSFAPYLELNYKSKATIETYWGIGKKFIFDNSKIDRMTKSDINNYLISYKSGRAIRTYNSMCAVIKLIFDGVLKQSQKTSHLKYIKPPNPLIEILSVEEVRSMVTNANNLKHQAIIATLYHTMARRSELLNLKIQNICSEIHEDQKHFKINIMEGKGGKGRSIPIPRELAVLLWKYIQKYNPKEYLFEGQSGGLYSESSLAEVLRSSYRGPKRIYPHLMRHSGATHLVDEHIQIGLFSK